MKVGEGGLTRGMAHMTDNYQLNKQYRTATVKTSPFSLEKLIINENRKFEGRGEGIN